MKKIYEGLNLEVISFDFADIICNSLEPDWKKSMADKSDIELVTGETN